MFFSFRENAWPTKKKFKTLAYCSNAIEERAWCDVENVTPRTLNARRSSTLRDFLGFACVLQAESVRSTQMWRSSGLKMATVKT